MKQYNHLLVSILSCCALAGTVLLASVESRASKMDSVQIVDLTVDNTSGNAFVRTNVNPTGSAPTCVAAGNNKGYAFNASTAAGKNLLSALTAALLANRNVFLQGFGSSDPCLDTSLGKFETLATVRILP